MLQMGLGVDLNMVRIITGEGNNQGTQENENSSEINFCTPEMITKYVERLRAKDRLSAKRVSKAYANPSEHPSHARKL